MKYQIFTPDAEAEFIYRPNRFVVEAKLNGSIVRAHCPNPGRMRELLKPGRKVFLEKSENKDRKTHWTLAAVCYENKVIPLISARSNNAAEKLILPMYYPDFRAEAEKTLGESRIDWKLSKPGKELWVEVKSCTLVEHKRAMFPDAPSSRAVKHLAELEKLKSDGSVIFTVMNSDAEIFSANPHTDPDFSIALKKSRDAGTVIHAVSLNCLADGTLKVVNPELPIDFSAAGLAIQDSGVVLKTWSEAPDKWRISIDSSETCLSKKIRSRRYPEGLSKSFRQDTSIAIRGKKDVFSNFEKEIENILGSDPFLKVFTSDPFQGSRILSLVLDYRHRRIFNS